MSLVQLFRSLPVEKYIIEPKIIPPMKNLLYYLLIFLTSITVSCSSEDFNEATPEEGGATPPTEETDPEADTPDNTATTPCDFDLSELTAGETKVIDCLLDLKGKIITLPAGVILEFDKGDIINGTLNFAEGGKIAGELLNSKLKIEGNAELIDPIFNFFAVRWEIVEGTVSIDVARTNLDIMQNTVDFVKSLGASTFNINKLDAFFDIEDPYSVGKVAMIKMPSDFHFKMSDQTNLRVFPTNRMDAVGLILIQEVVGVKVSGGFLHGDRNEHGENLRGGILLEIKGGQDVVVDNVHMSFSAWTALTINSIGRLGNPIDDGSEYFPSKNILISNCTFDTNAGNSLSITDGEDIIIDGCEFIKSGVDTEFSLGKAPRTSIDIEPFLGQRVDRVIIRNNTEREGAGNAFLASGGVDILMENNNTERALGWNEATNVRIINNTSTGNLGGIFGGLQDEFALSRSSDNVISGNTLINCANGIAATNDDIKIFDNKFVNCIAGIVIDGLKDSEIYNNTYESNKETSFGIQARNFADNVTVRNNTFSGVGRSFLIEGINTDEEEAAYKLIVTDNAFDNDNVGKIVYSRGIDITMNKFNSSGFGITSSTNLLINGNEIIGTNPSPTFTMNNFTTLRDITITNNLFDNRNSNQLSSYGVRINTVGAEFVTENSNILIERNTIKTVGGNYAIHSDEIDGITIRNNTLENSGENCCIISLFFNGNNSTIQDNVVPKGTEINGTNNIVSNNNPAN